MAYHLPEGYRENPMTTADGVGDDYWNDAKTEAGEVWQAAVYRFAATLVTPGQTVLDVGCGTGAKLRRFIAPVANRSIGVDQPSGIAQAQRLYPAGEWIAGDLGEDGLWSDLRALGADLTICSDVIEHLAEPTVLLDRLRGLGTRLVLSTPDRTRMYPAGHNGPPKAGYHVREWSAAEFDQLLVDNGLRVVERRHVLNRDLRPPVHEAKEAVWKVLHLQRPGRRRSCMVFVCDPA